MRGITSRVQFAIWHEHGLVHINRIKSNPLKRYMTSNCASTVISIAESLKKMIKHFIFCLALFKIVCLSPIQASIQLFPSTLSSAQLYQVTGLSTRFYSLETFQNSLGCLNYIRAITGTFWELPEIFSSIPSKVHSKLQELISWSKGKARNVS